MGRPVAISRHDILDAAAEEFSARGYAHTSLRQLMAAANVSTTAFYARYPSKQAVLVALVEALLADLLDRGREVLAAVTGASAAARLESGIAAGLEVLVSVLRDRRAVVALALTEGAAIDAVSAAIGRALDGLAELLAAQIAAVRGSRRRSRADRARAWSLVGALHLQVLRWSVYGQIADRDLEAELEATARALLVEP